MGILERIGRWLRGDDTPELPAPREHMPAEPETPLRVRAEVARNHNADPAPAALDPEALPRPPVMKPGKGKR